MNRLPASLTWEFVYVIMVRCDRRDVWWAPTVGMSEHTIER